MNDKKELPVALAAGLGIGIIAAVLVLLGNPANMGFCIACFVRDIAGAVGLHRAAPVQYIRPEIIGLVLGSLILALVRKEWSPKGGSAPMTRFVLGFFVMIGCLMFLGCPFRMILRLAGGDGNALFGLAGFVAGILCGVFFLNKGYTLRRTYRLPTAEGTVLPAIMAALLVLLALAPSFIYFSEEGPGSKHAPLLISLAAGLIVGAIAQRTRLCMVGGIRDVILFKDWTLICGFIAIIVIAAIGNIATGNFHLGFTRGLNEAGEIIAQPVAHTEHLWNFLGMTVVGLGSVLLGGCPLRQLILAGEGNTDSAVAVLGMFVGAAFCHNFKLASSGAGTTPNGRIACILMLVVMLVIAVYNTKKSKA